MYDFELGKNEKIKLISDDVIVGPQDKLCTVIITNKRLLVLAYPSMLYNAAEDLRMIGRINTIKMKEIIFETNIDNIKKICKENNYSKYILVDNNYILLESEEITNYFKGIKKGKNDI